MMGIFLMFYFTNSFLYLSVCSNSNVSFIAKDDEGINILMLNPVSILRYYQWLSLIQCSECISNDDANCVRRPMSFSCESLMLLFAHIIYDFVFKSNTFKKYLPSWKIYFRGNCVNKMKALFWFALCWLRLPLSQHTCGCKLNSDKFTHCTNQYKCEPLCYYFFLRHKGNTF